MLPSIEEEMGLPRYGNFDIVFAHLSRGYHHCCSFLTHARTTPMRAVYHALLKAHAYRVLISACIAMCMPDSGRQAVDTTA